MHRLPYWRCACRACALCCCIVLAVLFSHVDDLPSQLWSGVCLLKVMFQLYQGIVVAIVMIAQNDV